MVMVNSLSAIWILHYECLWTDNYKEGVLVFLVLLWFCPTISF
jgi:hypothetical protein